MKERPILFSAPMVLAKLSGMYERPIATSELPTGMISPGMRGLIKRRARLSMGLSVMTEIREHDPNHPYVKSLICCGHGRLFSEPCVDCEVVGLK